MHILVINSGSSSIKAAVVNHKTGEPARSLSVERLGEAGKSTARFDKEAPKACPETHEDALKQLLPELLATLSSDVKLEGVGHRIVHGGEHFTESVRLSEGVLAKMETLVPLAPLHMPANLAGARVAQALLPDMPHVAVFDTAFHATLPRRARTYGLPLELAEEHGLKRYGFHGTSHQYVATQAAHFLGEDVRDLRIITCHLGNGCSVCAVEFGRSVETSMGMTPLEGLVMGTRCGDLDPGIILHLLRETGMTPEQVDHLLNKESGLKGLSGIGNDMRDIEARAAEGDERCRMAIQVFCHQVRKTIGAYAAAMGGVDAIVFTAGIGENSEVVRHRIAQRLDFLGARIDEDLNRDVKVSRANPVAEITNRRSRAKMLVVATDELHAIAQSTARLCLNRDQAEGARPIPVAISARHVHLSQAHVEALFGPGHQLTPLRPLSQPGQFACEEVVTLIGPKRTIEKVRILGPARPESQVEISRTDEFHLGIDAPVRASGDIASSPGLTLVGAEGRKVELEKGVICAWRHIHMHPDDATHFGVQDRDVVEVEVGNPGERSLVFKDVLVRVHTSFKLEMHIDTDEANAAELSGVTEGSLMSSDGTATLRKRGVRFDDV